MITEKALDPRLPSTLMRPRLDGIIAIEPLQFVIQRRRRRLHRIRRIDAGHCGEPLGETGGGI